MGLGAVPNGQGTSRYSPGFKSRSVQLVSSCSPGRQMVVSTYFKQNFTLSATLTRKLRDGGAHFAALRHTHVLFKRRTSTSFLACISMI